MPPDWGFKAWALRCDAFVGLIVAPDPNRKRLFHREVLEGYVDDELATLLREAGVAPDLTVADSQPASQW
jgi:hypothetical protein